MKRIFLALLMFFLLVGPALADTVQVRLTWNHDLPEDLAGFRLYSDTASVTDCKVATGPMVSDIPYVVDQPLETTYQVVGPQGEVHYFKITAYDRANNESLCSEEVNFTIPDVDPSAPFEVTIEVIITP